MIVLQAVTNISLVLGFDARQGNSAAVCCVRGLSLFRDPNPRGRAT
jgi:hypothetical protein